MSNFKLPTLQGVDIKIKKTPQELEEDFQNLVSAIGATDVLDLRETDAYNRGFEEGKKTGFKQKSEEVMSVVSTLNDMIKKLKFVKDDIVTQIEPEVVQLSLMAAEKVLERELISGFANLTHIIHPILKEIPGMIKIIIRVHPEDIETLSEFKRDLIEEQTVENIEIKGDPAVSKGGCFIESDAGNIDASLETRMIKLKDAITGG